jgi:hypothetical protein
MDGNFNLEDWVVKAVENTKIDGITRDCHVSEIFHYKTLGSENKLLNSFKVFDDTVKILSRIDTKEICIYLNIDLESNNNVLSEIPKSFEDFKLLLNPYTIPEIIVYKPFMPEIIALVELYRVPILSNIYNFQKNINIFYKEFRTENDIINNEKFNKELNIVYNPY